MKIEIPFKGHKNILSLHEKTIEITKNTELTVNGDCIIGTNSSLACIDLPEKFKKRIQNSDSTITFTIVADGHTFSTYGKGSEKLTLKHTSDIVLRKSAFTCSRTIAIKCNKASDDIPRTMVKKLQNPKTSGKLIIEIK
ncbi:hypothetical protein AAA799D07_00377 [Marine Group I thaumarchaeote SCGC AAA799-D07]|nr:hypothetical protein AAA799D07_00377 [Marine Group I thaumarchaeote SCGC AAA799-D07]